MPDGLAKPSRWWPGIRAGHPLATDLEALLPMWEGQGGRAYDVASPFDIANHGTLTNGPTWEAGPNGSVIGLDGSTPYVGLSRQIAPVNGITLACRIRRTAVGQDGGLIANDIPAISDKGYDLFISNGSLRFGIGTGSGESQLTWSADPDSQDWQSVVGTYDRQTQRLYVDGDQVVSTTETAAMIAPASGLPSIGKITNFAGFEFTGQIDLAAIWSRGLAASEVAELAYDPYALSRQRAKTYIFATGGAPPATNRRRRVLIGAA